MGYEGLEEAQAKRAAKEEASCEDVLGCSISVEISAR
jgi:hypothetical protein